ncbi:MAG: oxidoreductase [Candidatus Nephthysia bennettiae]|nr:Gfo/Idh/MocA family oxidoreductase [Candidatus Dormibacteraeota bacterium]PZR97573.1 MAG: oxidoreductase [Candidatus Dormibacteraeota bacterium]
MGIVGYGYWGPNLARNFQEASGTRVVAISDLRPERLAQVQDRFPEARVSTDFRELLADPNVDAVVIATPVSTHYSLALAALQAGKHVLVEKPLASSSKQARELIDTAERLGRTLMVDHTFVYTGAVQKIKDLVDSGQLGRLYYYDSVRINLGLFQHDISVMWDLAVHDLAIMDYVLDRVPRAAAAIGVAHIPGRPVNMGYLTCFFDDDLIAHLHVNWLAPVKVRRTLISGDRQMIVYDDVEPSEKIKVYDKGITVTNGLGNGMEPAHDLLVGYRAGDMMAPQISLTEALRVEAQHFVECIRTGRRPLTDGWSGLRVIQVLEAAERSLADSGSPVELA